MYGQMGRSCRRNGQRRTRDVWLGYRRGERNMNARPGGPSTLLTPIEGAHFPGVCVSGSEYSRQVHGGATIGQSVMAHANLISGGAWTRIPLNYHDVALRPKDLGPMWGTQLCSHPVGLPKRGPSGYACCDEGNRHNTCCYHATAWSNALQTRRRDG